MGAFGRLVILDRLTTRWQVARCVARLSRGAVLLFAFATIAGLVLNITGSVATAFVYDGEAPSVLLGQVIPADRSPDQGVRIDPLTSTQAERSYDVPSQLARASARLGGYRLAPQATRPIAEIGPAGNPGLVGSGNFTGGGVLRHYTDDVGRAGIEASGAIRPGAGGRVYVTPTRYGSGAQAQAELALGRTPTGYFEIPQSRLPGLQGPHRVEPWGGQPGGGVECWVTCSVNTEGLKWFPIDL